MKRIASTLIAIVALLAGNDQLASKSLHPKSFADTVATILDAALSFFMSHG